jgi:hypothetical protein
MLSSFPGRPRGILLARSTPRFAQYGPLSPLLYGHLRETTGWSRPTIFPSDWRPAGLSGPL